MFKSLIATALLSASVGATPLQPRMLNNIGYQGSFTTRMYYDSEYDEYAPYGEQWDFGDIGAIDYTFDTTSDIYYYDYTHGYYVKCMLLRITCDSSKHVYVYYNDVVYSNTFSINSGDTYDDMSNNWCSFVLYFADVYNVPYNVSKLFNVFFSTESNDYVKSYTGWYNFSDTFATTLPSWTLMGNITANNSLVNNLIVSADDIYATYTSSAVSGISIDMYERPNWVSKSRNVYLTNCLIPLSVRNRMVLYGQFAYIPSGEVNDFQDLFYSIADTPIKLIYDMFNFELLGMGFASAIVSLLCLLVVVSVAKHVI